MGGDSCMASHMNQVWHLSQMDGPRVRRMAQKSNGWPKSKEDGPKVRCL